MERRTKEEARTRRKDDERGYVCGEERVVVVCLNVLVAGD